MYFFFLTLQVCQVCITHNYNYTIILPYTQNIDPSHLIPQHSEVLSVNEPLVPNQHSVLADL